jgi:peptidyl-prolyl cis-trans isomerase A (cyclophilin A)
VLAFLLGAALAAAPAPPLPRVLLRTGLGDVVLEVDLARAPATARNFLRHVEEGRYRGGSFHRTVTAAPDNQPGSAVKIEVIQAGPAPDRPDLPPIPLERTRDTGLRHLDGAVSMARDGPDTATGDFFVCIGDQPSLDFGGRRNPDGQGFGAFGRVVSGMEVVRRIHRAPAKGQALAPPVRILDALRLPSAPAEARP